MDEELLALILGQSANNYGAGPGYLGADENPHKRADERLNFLSDINRYAGVYLDDLLGLPEAPEEPGAAPVVPTGYQSDLREAYAGNELLQAAFKKIETGQADPFSVANELWALVQENPELASQLPMSEQFNGIGQESAPSREAIQSLLTTFAQDVAREKREAPENNLLYQQQLAEYDQQAQQYNDYFQPKSDFDLMGAPDLDTFVSQVKQRGGGADLPVSAAPPVNPRLSKTAEGYNFSQQDLVDASKASQGGSLFDRFRPVQQVREAVDTRRAQSQAETSRQLAGGSENQAWRNQAANDYRSKHLEKFAQQKLEKAKGRMHESQAQKDNKTRLQAVYSLLFGEAPPR